MKRMSNNQWLLTLDVLLAAGRSNEKWPSQLRVERCSSVSSVCSYVLAMICVKILHKCDETSLTVTHITVNLTLKWEVALINVVLFRSESKSSGFHANERP